MFYFKGWDPVKISGLAVKSLLAGKLKTGSGLGKQRVQHEDQSDGETAICP